MPPGDTRALNQRTDRQPPKSRVLPFHIAGAAALGAGKVLWLFIPFLARQRFDAGEWQTVVFTATVPVAQFFTIFWNHLYARIPVRTYFAIVGVLAIVPVVLMGTTTNIWLFMLYFGIAAFGGAFGGAALSPIDADMLRTCYAGEKRGRVFGFVSVAQYAAVMTCGQTIGWWSDQDRDAYQIFLPIVAGCICAGLLLYSRITRLRIFRERPRPTLVPTRHWWDPLRDMGRILRNDRRFASYEIAFMIYGCAFMICMALLPIMGTDLGLTNNQYALMTVTAFQFTFMLVLVPTGWLADRIGTMRLASASFLWLTLYPIGLLFCTSANGLGLATVFYALCLAGVHLTWTLGPVSLAPDASRAPHYLAVHGTLVGVRGIVAQGVGMFLYIHCGGFTVPLLVAAACFAVAGIGMRRLARRSSGGAERT